MTLTSRPADTLSTIAARVFGGDVRRFSEILDLNPDLDVFADLPPELELRLPDRAQIENFARPVLTSIASSLGGARGALGQAEEVITQIGGTLPPELQGYTQDALDLVGEANTVLERAETALDEVGDRLRGYDTQATNLVQWLLSGRA